MGNNLRSSLVVNVTRAINQRLPYVAAVNSQAYVWLSGLIYEQTAPYAPPVGVQRTVSAVVCRLNYRKTHVGTSMSRKSTIPHRGDHKWWLSTVRGWYIIPRPFLWGCRLSHCGLCHALRLSVCHFRARNSQFEFHKQSADDIIVYYIN